MKCTRKELTDVKLKKPTERRIKTRFAIGREMRYKILEDNQIVAAGRGMTCNISSGGVAFECDAPLPEGSFVELSISWPALLNDACPMRLIVFGRVLRGSAQTKACSVEKWEFRTQARTASRTIPMRVDGKLQRWAEYRKEVMLRQTTGAHA